MSAARRAVSPYARRLARERGLVLANVTGSGPGGRVVAADVMGFQPVEVANVPDRPSVPAAQAPAQTRLPEVLAATADLGALAALLATFEAAGRAVELEDVALRAAALALAATSDGPQGDLCFEASGGAVRLTGLADLSVRAIRARRETAAAGEAEGAALSLRVHRRSGIRSAFLPLIPGISLRMAVSFGEAAAECLLAFDADAVPVERAEAILAAFRDGLEAPLTLFV